MKSREKTKEYRTPAYLYILTDCVSAKCACIVSYDLLCTAAFTVCLGTAVLS